MQIPEWVVWIIAILIVVLPTSYFIFLLNNISDFFIANKIQRRIDRALIATSKKYFDDDNYDACLYEFSLTMQKLVPKSSFLSKKYGSLLTLLECFLINILSEKIIFDGDKEPLRCACYKFIEEYKGKNPLEEINGANYAVLKDLLDSKDTGKQKDLVNQIAIELKKKEDMILSLQTSNRTATMLSIIGVVLTILFGIIAIIQSL